MTCIATRSNNKWLVEFGGGWFCCCFYAPKRICTVTVRVELMCTDVAHCDSNAAVTEKQHHRGGPGASGGPEASSQGVPPFPRLDQGQGRPSGPAAIPQVFRKQREEGSSSHCCLVSCQARAPKGPAAISSLAISSGPLTVQFVLTTSRPIVHMLIHVVVGIIA